MSAEDCQPFQPEEQLTLYISEAFGGKRRLLHDERPWLVTFVPHSSELFQFASVCRTLFTGLKCKQLVSKQTGAGRNACKRCFLCEFEEQTLLARRLKDWRTLSTSRQLECGWEPFATN